MTDFWHGDESSEARYLAEHGATGSFDGIDRFSVVAGNADLLPPWPPVLPVRCAVCGTPVTERGEAGWRHDLGIRDTGGDHPAWPEG